ncbi:PAS domain-containing protein [Chondromyces crocatus]|uniref:Anti-anti-sigma factor n=1 Tax=Chondromyces crocatus TaxID=52 RepID=A0A0K1E5J3_CHOCO|nr:PAS domain-containing protein [Chondromyces crocatus]AKT36104.1 uncharacterized protein CMC5_002170 [Chondromyces crocatus]
MSRPPETQQKQRLSSTSLVLEISGDAAWEIPMLAPESAADPDTVTLYSPRFCELLGYKESELPTEAKSWIDAVLLEDQTTFRQAHRARIEQQGTTIATEYRVRNRQGEVRWWRETGRAVPGEMPGILRVFGLVRDITEAKEADELAVRRTALLAHTQSLARVGGWEFDIVNDKLSWLEETYRIHEVPLDYEPTVEKAINFYAPEHIPSIVDAAHRWHQGEPCEVQLDIITAKGNRVSVQATGCPHYEDGKVVRVYGCFRDISEAKRREEALRSQLALITRQQRAILDLSTPIIQLWNGIITLPLIGNIDASRAAQIMVRLLDEIVRVGARFAILDLTGVDTVDSTTADQLFCIARAADLIGAKALFCGLTPPVAQSMTSLGIDMTGFLTYRNLQEALQASLRTLGASLPGSHRRASGDVERTSRP